MRAWNLVPLFMAGVVAVSGCGSRRESAQPLPGIPVTLGLGMEADSGLAFLAEQKNLFKAANLAVAVSNYPSGKLALGALLRGEVEMATAAQTPIVTESFSRRDLRILAVLGSSDNLMKIVARKDAGIRGPGDLYGRRIATQSMSFMHFFLGLYLLKNGIQPGDAELVFGQPDELPAMLERGDVQAAVLREPLTTRAVSRLGDSAVVLQDPGLCVRYYCLVTTDRVLREKPRMVEGVLRALLEAAEVARRKPESLEGVIAERLQLNDASVQRMRREIDFRVTLPQSLLVSLEDEARWVVFMNGHAEEIPNYLHYLEPGPLAGLQPEAVSVIH